MADSLNSELVNYELINNMIGVISVSDGCIKVQLEILYSARGSRAGGPSLDYY